MKNFFTAALTLLIMNSAAAQDINAEVDRGVSSVKQRTFDFSAETRFFTPNLNAQLKADDFRYNCATT